MDRKEYILSKVKQKIKDVDPDAKIFLFGSRARNDSSKESDWDFLVITDAEVTRDFKNKINDQLFETELETDEILTAIVQNSEFWKKHFGTPFFKNIQKDAVEL